MKELKSIKALDDQLVMSIEETGRLFGKNGKYRNLNRKRNAGGAEVAILLVILLVIVAIVVGPLITIWAINGLFGLTITYTLKHWFCALLLGGALRGISFNSKKD